MTYDLPGLVSCFAGLGIRPGSVVYVLSAMWRVPGYAGPVESMCGAYYEALRRLVDDSGTIVVPTHSQNLCNTDIVFDLDVTPSYERGIFAEHVRQLPAARRSFHPFNSYAAVGPHAEAITADVSRHAYGPMTPEARMIEMGARVLIIGLPPNVITTVHHVEQVMAVPYRYTKEFMHPVMRGGEVVVEPFYLYVWYRNADIERDQNRSLLQALAKRMEIRTARLGRGELHSYGMDDFFREAVPIFAEDPYTWCSTAPTIRPWRQ